LESGIEQRQLEEIKARYGIGSRSAGPGRFPIVLIKPSHYDDDGYVIQWYRSAVPSNSLAVLHGLIQDCRERKVLGEQVKVEIRSMDEYSTRIRTDRLARELKDGQGLVILVGVQSNQFPRAMDIALPLRVAGVHVCMGGVHISGSISVAGGITPELQEAMNLGISLFAGNAEEGRLDQVLRDAWSSQMKPLYDYLGVMPSTQDSPAPMAPANPILGTIGQSTSVEAARGRPVQCAFSTILAAPGQEARLRTVEELEHIIRRNLDQGVGQFFITDDDFSRNPDWERIFDRLIEMREEEKLNIQLMLQVDAMCHRIPEFIEKAGRAGVRRVFVRLENIHGDSLTDARPAPNRIEYRRMLREWKHTGAIVFAAYMFGLPGETPERVRRDVRIIQKELAVDLLEPCCPTATGGNSEALSEYYTPEHMETVLRRAAATGIPLEDMMALLLPFHFCTAYEKIDPLQGGYLRRRSRTDRRSTLPKEKFVQFYRKYGGELIYKFVGMAQLSWRFHRFTRRLEREPDAKKYVDWALMPDSEMDGGTLETPRHIAPVR
jgi:hypothetical protein